MTTRKHPEPAEKAHKAHDHDEPRLYAQLTAEGAVLLQFAAPGDAKAGANANGRRLFELTSREVKLT